MALLISYIIHLHNIKIIADQKYLIIGSGCFQLTGNSQRKRENRYFQLTKNIAIFTLIRYFQLTGNSHSVNNICIVFFLIDTRSITYCLIFLVDFLQ